MDCIDFDVNRLGLLFRRYHVLGPVYKLMRFNLRSNGQHLFFEDRDSIFDLERGITYFCSTLAQMPFAQRIAVRNNIWRMRCLLRKIRCNRYFVFSQFDESKPKQALYDLSTANQVTTAAKQSRVDSQQGDCQSLQLNFVNFKKAKQIQSKLQSQSRKGPKLKSPVHHRRESLPNKFITDMSTSAKKVQRLHTNRDYTVQLPSLNTQKKCAKKSIINSQLKVQKDKKSKPTDSKVVSKKIVVKRSAASLANQLPQKQLKKVKRNYLSKRTTTQADSSQKPILQSILKKHQLKQHHQHKQQSRAKDRQQSTLFLKKIFKSQEGPKLPQRPSNQSKFKPIQESFQRLLEKETKILKENNVTDYIRVSNFSDFYRIYKSLNLQPEQIINRKSVYLDRIKKARNTNLLEHYIEIDRNECQRLQILIRKDQLQLEHHLGIQKLIVSISESKKILPQIQQFISKVVKEEDIALPFINSEVQLLLKNQSNQETQIIKEIDQKLLQIHQQQQRMSKSLLTSLDKVQNLILQSKNSKKKTNVIQKSKFTQSFVEKPPKYCINIKKNNNIRLLKNLLNKSNQTLKVNVSDFKADLLDYEYFVSSLKTQKKTLLRLCESALKLDQLIGAELFQFNQHLRIIQQKKKKQPKYQNFHQLQQLLHTETYIRQQNAYVFSTELDYLVDDPLENLFQAQGQFMDCSELVLKGQQMLRTRNKLMREAAFRELSIKDAYQTKIVQFGLKQRAN